MKQLKIFVFLFFSVATIYAQSEKSKMADFKNAKLIQNNEKAVYMHIINVGGTEQANKIQNDLLSDQNISSCFMNLEPDGRYACKIIMKRNISPDYIRNYILYSGADIDPASVISNNIPEKKSPEMELKKRGDGMPEHYPVFVDTGNPEYDNSVYDQAKQEWIKNYPEEVSKITGRKIDEFSNEKK